jgi:hypothetical protein
MDGCSDGKLWVGSAEGCRRSWGYGRCGWSCDRLVAGKGEYGVGISCLLGVLSLTGWEVEIRHGFD